MVNVTVQKTVVDDITGEELLYVYTATAETEALAMQQACIYASMIEYALLADKWTPREMAFPREQLYQFIQPATLEQLENMYPDAVSSAYSNALAYVSSYFGNMFDIDAMLGSGDTTATALTLRLCLCISTVTFLLASSPQYSEVIEQQNKQLHFLLRGLKSGSRNFGKAAIAAEPNVRVDVITPLAKTQRP